MSAVLNVVRRPVALGRCVIPFVEERVKSLKDECFILFLFRLAHCLFLQGKTPFFCIRVLGSSRSNPCSRRGICPLFESPRRERTRHVPRCVLLPGKGPRLSRHP